MSSWKDVSPSASFRSYNDFYNERDDCVRGITLQPNALSLCIGPYDDKAEVTRGVTIPAGFAHELPHTRDDNTSSCGVDVAFTGEIGNSSSGAKVSASQPTTTKTGCPTALHLGARSSSETTHDCEFPCAQSKASADDPSEGVQQQKGYEECSKSCPPDFPTYSAATTFYVILPQSQPPSAIWNATLKFLTTKMSSCILKERQEKYWITANVFSNTCGPFQYGMCTLKIRIYKSFGDSYPVEFSRRGGDAMVFAKVFQDAIGFYKDEPNLKIRAELGVITSPPQFLRFEVPRSPFGESIINAQLFTFDDVIGPVIDMATTKEQPSLQAESAQSLATLAEQEDVERFCIKSVFDVIKQHLISVRTTEVGFPLARLLHRLVDHNEAAALFTDIDFLNQIITEVRARTQDTLVFSEFASLIKFAAKRWGSQIPPLGRLPLAEKTLEAASAEANSEAKGFLSQAREALQEAANLYRGFSN